MNDNNKNPPKIKIEGKPKYINIGNDQDFLNYLEKLKKVFQIAFCSSH